MVADRIEQLPLLLDCFGNAATDGNANSSRHVRYLELKFTDSGKLSGAIVSVYLLEKWRICDSLSKLEKYIPFLPQWCSPIKYLFHYLGPIEITTSSTTSITDWKKMVFWALSFLRAATLSVSCLSVTPTLKLITTSVAIRSWRNICAFGIWRNKNKNSSSEPSLLSSSSVRLNSTTKLAVHSLRTQTSWIMVTLSWFYLKSILTGIILPNSWDAAEHQSS